jgi:hypothetical protein
LEFQHKFNVKCGRVKYFWRVKKWFDRIAKRYCEKN